MPLARSDRLNPAADAFTRLRVSTPTTLFDSKQLVDTLPLLWDDQETDGGGTGTTYDADRASTTLDVTASTAGVRTRQTFQRFNYQPGKSLLVMLTGVFGAAATGIQRDIGYGDASNGIFLRQTSSGFAWVRRSFVTGAAVDETVAQADWNLERLDGTHNTGWTLDPTMAQIIVIDLEWLGVGRVRVGFVIDGAIVYCHEFLHSNRLASVYMSSANLPLHYRLENDGDGGAATLECICGTVITEGGSDPTGVLRARSSGAVATVGDGALTAIIGIRLKSAALGIRVDAISASTLIAASAPHEWQLVWNPTVADSDLPYADLTNSAVQTGVGDAANTVTDGTLLASGYVASATRGNAMQTELQNALRLGANIAGTADRLVLAVRPILGGGTTTVYASLTWREWL